MKYLPFQHGGIEHIRFRQATYLADQMGLGKTIQACGVINRCPDIIRVLVICPASVKLNWQRELETWCPWVIVGQAMPKQWPDTPVVIINFDILHRYPDELRAYPWDLVVIDEAHKLVNLEARRTVAVVGDGRTAPIPARRKLAMSGTPMVNRPRELFPMLHWLDPVEFPSYHAFGERYCGGEGQVIIQQFGYSAESRRSNYAKFKQWAQEVGHDGKPKLSTTEWFDFEARYRPARLRSRMIDDYRGSSNLEELRDRILGGLMLRRMKKDVLTQLPPKRRQVIELDPSAKLRRLLNKEMALWDKLQLGPDQAMEVGFRHGILDQEDSVEAEWEEISTLRSEAAQLKVPMTIEYLKDAVASSGKVVCFVHHKDTVSKIVQEFPRCSFIDGSVSQANRQVAVDRFQNDPSVGLFIGTSAAAEGITLTASSHVVIAEWFWGPGILSQMEDRCHRIGSEGHDSILVQYLLLQDSMDIRMAQTVIRKQMLEDRLLN